MSPALGAQTSVLARYPAAGDGVTEHNLEQGLCQTVLRQSGAFISTPHWRSETDLDDFLNDCFENIYLPEGIRVSTLASSDTMFDVSSLSGTMSS